MSYKLGSLNEDHQSIFRGSNDVLKTRALTMLESFKGSEYATKKMIDIFERLAAKGTDNSFRCIIAWIGIAKAAHWEDDTLPTTED